MTLQEIVTNKRKEIFHLAEMNGVKTIKLFGSVIRNEDHSESDIDFLVEFEEDRNLFDLIRLKNDLEDEFERNVDVVTINSLHEGLREQILNEAIDL